jgi:hypothetical protein
MAALLPWGKRPLCLLDRLGGPRAGLGTGEEKSPLPINEHLSGPTVSGHWHCHFDQKRNQ